MTLTNLVIGMIALVAVLTAGAGFRLWRGRRHVPDKREDPLTLIRMLGVARERVARVIAPGRSAPDRPQLVPRPGDTVVTGQPSAAATLQEPASTRWPARPSPQALQTLGIPGISTLEDDWPPGLAVAVHTAGSARAAQQDVYYVQRNLLALARGLTDMEGRRAASLALSAVMTSGLGQAPDVEQALLDGASAANRLVRSISRRDPQYSDMVTTLDVVYMESDRRKFQLHYAHVGSSTIWLQQAGSPAVKPLTKPHVLPDGPVMRAVGLARNIAPDTGRIPVEVGDRIFLTTAGSFFAFTEPLMNAAAGYRADRPLHDAVAALAETVHKAEVAEEVMIVGAEVARPGAFFA